MADLYSKIANFYGTFRFAQYTAAWDENQVFFYNVMLNIENPGTNYENWYHDNDQQNLPWCEWHDEMIDILNDTISASIKNNYAYYIAPGDVHTILMNNEVYTLTVNGVRFVDWLKIIVEGGSTFSNVVCTDCQQPDFVCCP